MNMCLETCFYQEQKNGIEKFINPYHLSNIGFNTTMLCGKYQDLLAYLSNNKADILIIDACNVDCEQFSYVLEIIYNNFCKNILLISDDNIELDDAKEGIILLDAIDKRYFDLKIDTILLKIKKEYDNQSCRNIPLIKSKICEFLLKLKFNSKLDGFKYYIEAVWRVYQKFPQRYSMMEIYQEIGDAYGKSAYAVEKSMRSALLSAIKKLNSLPSNEENLHLQNLLAYDMNNKLTTNMLLTKLLLDKDISESIDKKAIQFIYQ